MLPINDTPFTLYRADQASVVTTMPRKGKIPEIKVRLHCDDFCSSVLLDCDVALGARILQYVKQKPFVPSSKQDASQVWKMTRMKVTSALREGKPWRAKVCKAVMSWHYISEPVDPFASPMTSLLYC